MYCLYQEFKSKTKGSYSLSSIFHRMLGQANQTYVQQTLRSIVIHSLDHFNYANAEFACERLLADDATNLDSIYLYCLTQYRQGKFKSCFNRSSNLPDHLGCSYIYSKLCLQLKKYKEGVFQLIKINYLYNENSSYYRKDDFVSSYFASPSLRYHYEQNRSVLPDLSTIYHLLGDLYKGLGDIKQSALNYAQAMKYNQFDYEAFQKLCKLGVDVNTKALFRPCKDNLSQPQPGPKEYYNYEGGNDNSGDITNPFSSHGSIYASRNKLNPGYIYSKDDTTSNHSLNTPKINEATLPDAPARKQESHEMNNRFEFAKPNFPTDSNILEQTNRRDKLSTYSKLTSRLISQPVSNQKVMEAHNSNTSNLRPAPRIGMKRNNSNSFNVSGINGNVDRLATLNILTEREIELTDSHLMSLYMIFAKGFKCIARYDCYKAIRILESLPRKEKETPWILSKLGRLHFELVNYKQSEFYFIKLRRLERTRLEDMEYFSTLLWHLHKKVELAFLANELHDIDSTSPITWCAIGNLFSLTREPDEAIKCFNKAIKYDDLFTYAYTLKGHEYFGNDNYEMALENFRISLLLDPRHYNALYGIGMVYINLGDYQKADYHFRKAVSINPINIILICCVGMVLEKVGKKNLALKQYELANKLQPLNPLPIFKKAQLLFSMQQFLKALENFKVLKNLAPDEASVHFLLGQLYNIQNDKFEAIKEFTIAFNLDPKGNYLIREAMESLKEK